MNGSTFSGLDKDEKNKLIACKNIWIVDCIPQPSALK